MLWLGVRTPGATGKGTQAVENAEGFGGTGAADPVVDRMGNELSEFAAHQFVNALEENAPTLATLRCDVRNTRNDANPVFQVLSHPNDPGPGGMDAKLFATIQSAVDRTHPSAKVIPMNVPWGSDRQSLAWRCQLLGGGTRR